MPGIEPTHTHFHHTFMSPHGDFMPGMTRPWNHGRRRRSLRLPHSGVGRRSKATFVVCHAPWQRPRSWARRVCPCSRAQCGATVGVACGPTPTPKCARLTRRTCTLAAPRSHCRSSGSTPSRALASSRPTTGARTSSFTRLPSRPLASVLFARCATTRHPGQRALRVRGRWAWLEQWETRPARAGCPSWPNHLHTPPVGPRITPLPRACTAIVAYTAPPLLKRSGRLALNSARWVPAPGAVSECGLAHTACGGVLPSLRRALRGQPPARRGPKPTTRVLAPRLGVSDRRLRVNTHGQLPS